MQRPVGCASTHFYRIVGGLGLLLASLAGLVTGCHGGGKTVGDGGGPQRAEVQAPAPGAYFETLAQDIQATGTVIRLRWSGRQAPPDEPPTLAFCLPAEQRITARWLEARVGGRPIRLRKSNETAPPPTTTPSPAASRALSWRESAGPVEFAGYLRHWPIYRLKLERDVLAQGGEGSDLELTLELKWPRSVERPTSPPPNRNDQGAMKPGEAGWQRIAEGLVQNPAALARFYVDRPPLASGITEVVTDPRRQAPGDRPWARMQVAQEGLVRLDLDDLIKVGFPTEKIRPEAVRVFSHGQAVQTLIAPGPLAPKDFKPGVYFWAWGGSGAYSATRAYWVTLGADLPTDGLRLDATGLNPAIAKPVPTIQRLAVREEKKKLETIHGSFLAIEGMQWVETALDLNKPLAVPLVLPRFVPHNGPLKGQIELFVDDMESRRPFKLVVSAAGTTSATLATLPLTSLPNQKLDFALPASYVRDERTTLTLRLISDSAVASGGDEAGGGVWFSRAQVAYGAAARLIDGRLTLNSDRPTTQTTWTPLPDLDGLPGRELLLLRVAAVGEPVQLWPVQADGQGHHGIAWKPQSGARIECYGAGAIPDAPPLEPVQLGDLTSENQGCDLLIISHADFMGAARRLAEFHQAAGWTVRVVDVQSIYDTFSNGELSPLAIKAMLAYTLRHWRLEAPGQVLLLGDCTSDYLGITRNGVRNWVPTYTFTNGADKWASDYWFTTVFGEDDFGDLAISRLSVANQQDAEAVVSKIINYAKNPRPGPWRARLAYVADDGEFEEVVEDVRRHDTPAAYGNQRVYLGHLPLEDNWYLPRDYVERKRMKVSRTATTEILRTFQSGVSCLMYYGHGSPNIWADERIWFGGDSPNSDNLHLTGTGYCPFVANMTCNSGAIDYPLTPWNVCIIEDMMRVADGGAIACYVPSGPGITTLHREMSRALRGAMFDRGLRGLGEFTTLAKARYALERQSREMLYMYLLLGDPALDLQLTARRGEFGLGHDVFAPGQTVEVDLGGITPEAGHWIGELVNEKGETLWASPEAEYHGGRLRLKAAIPATAATGEAHLRLYCWDAQGGDDLAISGKLMIQTPRLELGSLVLDPDGHGATARVLNPTRLAARGELELRLLDGATSRSLDRQAVALGGGESKAIRLALAMSEAEVQRPLAIEAALSLPTLPDGPGRPQVMRQRLALPPPQGWSGWIEPLCSLDAQGAEGVFALKATAVLPVAAGGWLACLRTAQGLSLTTQTLTLTVDPAAGRPRTATVSFSLEPQTLERLRGGSLFLRPPGAAGNAEATLALPLAQIRRRDVRLRIVPGSIATRPANPTEGETVFVDCTLENAGEVDADPATVELLDRAPKDHGEALPNSQGSCRERSPRLAAGRRVPLTLRWDPTGNAGERTVWLHVVATLAGMAPGHDRALPLKITARTKAKLSIGRAWAESSPKELEEHQIRLKAQVKNSGQTDAHNVMVNFYRSALQTPENKLGEVELKLVPGAGATDAAFTWSFDPLRDMVQGTEMPRPTVQVWLKGSSQRISSTDEGVEKR